MALVGQALVARLNDGTGVNANHGIISGVLVTVGDLTRVVCTIQFLVDCLVVCFKIKCLMVCLV